MFWTGLIIGLFIGANVGILIMALCNASAMADVSAKRAVSASVERMKG